MLKALFPQPSDDADGNGSLKSILEANGFDAELHEQIRSDLRTGRIGVAQNRLPPSTVIEDVCADDVTDASGGKLEAADRRAGEAALAGGEVAILALAGGAGSRWTRGAGVVKALHPFCRFGGKYRNFIEIHLAKAAKTATRFGAAVPVVVSTSYLTHEPIEQFLRSPTCRGYAGPLMASPGRSIGLRMIPMTRDLRFAWEEMPQQILDVQAQKVRESLHAALIGWAEAAGGGSDYTDNAPAAMPAPDRPLVRAAQHAPQRHARPVAAAATGVETHPPAQHRHARRRSRSEPAGPAHSQRRRADVRGHFAADRRPRRRPGAGQRPRPPRRGPGHAPRGRRVPPQLLQLANHMDINRSPARSLRAPRRPILQMRTRCPPQSAASSMRLPTYVTLKDVKKRWGHAQEDIYPVAQFEKLWSDMTGLPEAGCQFVVVSRQRGQQLKDPAQLDGWLRDGSAAYVDGLCMWEK